MRLRPLRFSPMARNVALAGLMVGGVGAAGFLAVWWSDRVITALYEAWRPRLERSIGQAMGHPLELGPYQGLRPWGLQIGRSGFGPGPADRSTASAGGVTVSIDPLTSLRRREIVLELGLAGARADLRRNARGQFWVLGKGDPAAKPPPLDLRVRVREPARLTIRGLGGRDPLELTASADLGVRLSRSSLDLRARVGAPGLNGHALVRVDGDWKLSRWRIGVSPRRFPVEALRPLLPLQGTLAGETQGHVRLTLAEGRLACDGAVEVEGFRWRRGPAASPLAADRLPLHCAAQELTLAPSAWSFDGWRGEISARADVERRLGLQLRARPPRRAGLGTLPLVAELRGRWGGGALQVAELRATRGRSRLRLSGSVGKTLSLAGSWRLQPAELPLQRPLPDWVLADPLEGTVRAAGTPADPLVGVTTGQSSHPLLGAWQASLAWGGRALRLERFSSPHLTASGRIPLVRRPGRGLQWGDLDARLRLDRFPLQRLEPVVGTPLKGSIDLVGTLRGPLASLRPDVAVTVREPGAGPLWLRETWSGTLAGLAGGGARLGLSSQAPALPGRIEARLDRDWLPVRLQMRRREGTLSLAGRPAGYRWSAQGFPLAGLSLLLGPKQTVEPLEGDLSGAGNLSLQPLAFAGRVDLERPRFLGLGGRRIAAEVSYRDRAYRVKGEVEPLSAGRIEIAASGRWQGPVQAEVSARGLDTVLLQQLAALVPRFRGEGEAPAALADAAALGSLAIDPPPGSLIDQLEALRDALALKARRDEELAAAGPAERLARLQIGIDADLKVSGPDLRRARATLEATGHIWKGYPDLARELTDQPFEVRLEGPLGAGEGTFAVTGLSLALLSLVGPLPREVSGRLALQGRYRLGPGRPQLSVELALQDAALAGQPLRLERGRIDLEGDRLALDLALRAEGATSSVELSGTVPLDPAQQGIRLRLASRDDGIHFLAALAGPRFEWREGSADLQLLVRGSLRDPIANGFLRIGDGRFGFIGQSLEDVQATVLFDFQQMLLQELTARVGKAGRIRGEGAIGLLRPLGPGQGLSVELEEVPFSVPRITAVGNGRLQMLGSLASPRLGGEVIVSRGTINATRGSLADAPPESDQPATPSSISQLREARWDFKEPLVLLGPEVESDTGASVRDAVPKVSWLAFDNLALVLGPDLRVVMPNVANFRTGGRLRITGRLDPSLRASGVVRLLGGQLNLFTTTFTLDPSAPNVAIFTPSLGLVPYLDVALRTRISDSLGSFDDDASPVAGWGLEGGSGAPSVAELQQVESFSSLGQLQLILVTVSVSGPADRIADNLELRSSPPLPRDRLIALIGGNTLAGLTGGAAGTALATAVGQTLLSPLLSSLTDALGQRVSLAIYPTYVNPEVQDRREYSTEKVPPQLVLGTEVGVDVTPRLNASVLAAPNRTDVPPQLNFSWKASDVLTLRGGVDTQGAWQSQLQVFFRF